jgi:methionine transaminase
LHIHSKLPHIGTTIFTTMSALAREHGAINLSQGFPDFDCAKRLRELATKYINDGHNQYAPMAGTHELRERIAHMLLDCYSASYNVGAEITVTAGATQAIFTAVAAFVKPGDEVIIFEPAYDCYAPAVEVQGGKVIYSRLHNEHFTVDWEDVKSKLTSRTKMILINSPHNPSGTILSESDMRALEKVVGGRDIVVVSDEVYEHMVFDGARHESVARYPSLRSQSVLVSSFGKTVHTTGWKIGYVAAPEPLMREFRKVHQFLVFVVNHPLQLALAEYLADPTVYKGLAAFYQAKRDLFLKLTSGSRLVPLPCRGTYFQLMRYDAVSSEDDAALAMRLTKEKKLATVPLSAFYFGKDTPGLLRFCFAKRDETLAKAAEIIRSL